MRRLLDARKIDLEGRAFAKLTVNADVAAGLLDDGLAGGQTQTCASAFGLGREKRLEQMRLSWCEQKETSLCDQKENNAPGLLPAHRSLMFSLAASAEDRALRGRNPSAA
jgi:hypothetical protein